MLVDFESVGFTIRQVSQMTGLSTHTIRFYERRGLLQPATRALNGYRQYSLQEIEQLAFLHQLRSTGMSIDNMRLFARAVPAHSQAVITARLALLEQHCLTVRAQLRELTRGLHAMQQLLETGRWEVAAATASVPE